MKKLIAAAAILIAAGQAYAGIPSCGTAYRLRPVMTLIDGSIEYQWVREWTCEKTN